MMDRREERVAKNEAGHRELNELIEKSYESHPNDAYMDAVCECGIAGCEVFLRVTKAEYEEVRADPRRFMILRDHLDPLVDDLVSETDRFALVAKRQGTPSDIATATDPRS
jgi:hypothetical protein